MTKNTGSGAILDLNIAGFAESHRLMKAVAKEFGSVKFSTGETDLKKIMSMNLNDEMLNSLKDLVAQFLSSSEIEAALWPCMSRCTYNGLKIDAATFEPEKSREDFIEVAKEVLVLNLRPFSKSLLSLLTSTLTKTATANRE